MSLSTPVGGAFHLHFLGSFQEGTNGPSTEENKFILYIDCELLSSELNVHTFFFLKNSDASILDNHFSGNR